MSGNGEWAFEGRKISRKAFTERDPEASSEVSLPLTPAPEGAIDPRFDLYVRVFGLTTEDVVEGKSICVVGAADNVFAAGLKRAFPDGKHAFVMGVDPAEKRYQQLDPAIINHDARSLGFPSDFEGFDLVLSLDAVPKYFFLWGAKKENREDIITGGGDIFDYSIADREASNDEIESAIYDAVSEMLRITKPGGTVKMYPILMPTRALSRHYMIMQSVIGRLSKVYPGIEVYGATNEKDEHNPENREFMPISMEITRPLEKEG